MATSLEKARVAKKYFPHEVILWMLRHCTRSPEFKVGFYQCCTYVTWSFKGKTIATGAFPTDMFDASFKVVGFGNYRDTEIRGYDTKEYKHLEVTK